MALAFLLTFKEPGRLPSALMPLSIDSLQSSGAERCLGQWLAGRPGRHDGYGGEGSQVSAGLQRDPEGASGRRAAAGL